MNIKGTVSKIFSGGENGGGSAHGKPHRSECEACAIRAGRQVLDCAKDILGFEKTTGGPRAFARADGAEIE